MAEKFLYFAQVRTVLQQVGGEAVAQGVGAPAPGEAGVAGVALDDLVEPLAGQRPAAEVEEERALVVVADEVRAAGAEVDADRGRIGLRDALRSGHPSIEVMGGRETIDITTWMMVPGEERIVAKRVRELLEQASKS